MSLYRVGMRCGQDVEVIGADVEGSSGTGLREMGSMGLKGGLILLGIFGVVFAVSGSGGPKRTAYDNHPAYKRLK